ncbi:MAG: triose-phosphate isomerase, partial [bacterium]
PYTFLPEIRKTLNKTKISIGAQDVGSENGGSFTGEVSVKMLKDTGCSYVIVGHSERRKLGETDEVVSQKVYLSSKIGLHTLLCIGENTRDDHGQFWHDLKDQLTITLLKINRPLLKKIVIAYEPVWAIGQSEAMSPAVLHETVIFIRKVLYDLYGRTSADEVKIIYGGSVDTKNAKELVEKGTVDGVLVGRDSLKAKDFVKIVCEVESI